MPRKIRLVSAGLREDGPIENVRQSAYFLQVFQDDWGPKNLFRKIDDTSLPRREIVVCLKDAPHQTDPELLGLRKELEETQGVEDAPAGGV